MDEYPVNPSRSVKIEIRRLVEAAYQQDGFVYAVVNDVVLLADSRHADRTYVAQLEWTYQIVSDERYRPFLERRRVYQNLVPELQARAHMLKQRYSLFEHGSAKTQLRLLTELTLVTACKWAWTGREARVLARLLANSPYRDNPLISQARQAFEQKQPLLPNWTHDTRTWLMTDHN